MACTIDCGIICCHPFKIEEAVTATATFFQYFFPAFAFIFVMAGIFTCLFCVIDFIHYVNDLINEVNELSERVKRIEGLEAGVARLVQSQLDAHAILDRLIIQEREREHYGYGAIYDNGDTTPVWTVWSELLESDFSDSDYMYDSNDAEDEYSDGDSESETGEFVRRGYEEEDEVGEARSESTTDKDD
ncbi:hypothetical protein TWF481_006572 [Arthrobotrys musiformis]|uniref:Uncharacterized protein n=1 Tax=Arthrobotrys musiformis TaxID=47236 RepID=A0AAV9WAM0_9PEZI